MLAIASERRCNGVGDTYHDYAINACQAEGQAFAIETCVADVPLWDRYIFQSNLPGPLAADQAAVLSPEGPPKDPFSFSLKGVKDRPFFRLGPGGTVQIADSRNFLANKYVAASLVTLVPGGSARAALAP